MAIAVGIASGSEPSTSTIIVRAGLATVAVLIHSRLSGLPIKSFAASSAGLS